MTALELTNWSGVDKGGSFLLMFGHINTTPDPDEMRWTRLRPDGIIAGEGLCSYVDADTFLVEKDDKGYSFIAGADPGNCDFSITSDVLTLTMDSTTIKLRQVT